jgi:hypothetical protein
MLVSVQCVLDYTSVTYVAVSHDTLQVDFSGGDISDGNGLNRGTHTNQNNATTVLNELV